MSGEEFLNVASERSCFEPRICGYPICKVQIQSVPDEISLRKRAGKLDSKANQNDVAARIEERDMYFCSSACETKSRKFSERLGSSGDAYYRFDKLFSLAKERKEKFRKASTSNLERLQSRTGTSLDSKSDGEEAPAAVQSTASLITDTLHSGISDAKRNINEENNGKAKAVISTKSSLKKPTEHTQSQTLSQTKLAAGTAKTPVMAAEVKERDPSTIATAPFPPTSSRKSHFRKSHAIEGYTPRHRYEQSYQSSNHFDICDSFDDKMNLKDGESSTNLKEQGKRVHFNDTVEASDGSRNVLDQSGAQSSESSCMMADEYGWEGVSSSNKEKQLCTNNGKRDTDKFDSFKKIDIEIGSERPIITFEIEDTETTDDDRKNRNLGAQFGHLRVDYKGEKNILPGNTVSREIKEERLNEENTRVDSNENKNMNGFESSGQDNRGREQEITNQEASVDEVLTRRLRENIQKIFPQLKGTLPSEVLKEIMGEELSDSRKTESDTESNEDNFDDWTSSDENDDEYQWKPKYTFFGELYRHLNFWVTDATISLLNSDQHAAPPAAVSGSVPEIESAFRRFIGIGIPKVLTELRLLDKRTLVERSINELITTFSMTVALPAFNQNQWRIISLIFIKALSLHRLPDLQPLLESRQGIHLVNKILAEGLFTVEEFAAALQELLGDEG